MRLLARTGPLSESVYGRTWHAARATALGPELAATGLARRPYHLRHAALSLWLNAGGAPARIAARAGHSVAVLLAVYTYCIHGHDDILNQQIDDALRPTPSAPRTSPCRTPHHPGRHRCPRRRPLCAREPGPHAYPARQSPARGDEDASAR
jgi:hypothetical protein